MRYDRDHKAQTRERVLKEAAAAIRTDGPERVGVATIMSRAGLTHGGFYAHFASKDDLLAEAVDYMFADAHAAFFADTDAMDPRAALGRYVDYYLSMRHRDARDRGCPVPILAGELHRMPAAARDRFAAAVDRLKERLVALLERAGIDNAQARTNSAVAEMVGAIGLARVSSDRAAAEALLDHARRSVGQRLDLDAN